MLNKKSIIFLIFIFIFFSVLNVKTEDKIEHKIAVLVNEQVITSYDIIQRIKLDSVMQNININNLNNQIIVNNAVDELIKEKLKLEKINEYNIEINDNEYLNFEINFFKNNNLDKERIILILKENNIDYQNLKDRLVGEILWNKLISSLYYRFTSVSDLEVDEIIKKNPSINNIQAKNLVIQRQLDLQSSKLLRDMMNEATIEYR
tara:strand:+ start:1521 stop:2135 length:615 start_codon:yes stop_codon:yes gene_type:complete